MNVLSFTACSQQTTQAAAAATSADTALSEEQTTVYGKVTAIDGTKVTLALGTLDQQGGKKQDNASGSASGSNNAPKGTPPSGGNGRGFNQLALTGAIKTITISDTSILTKLNMRGQGGKGGKGDGQSPSGSSSKNTENASSAEIKNNTNSKSSGSPAALSDITVGSILKVTYETSSEKLGSVEIMGGSNNKQLPASSK